MNPEAYKILSETPPQRTLEHFEGKTPLPQLAKIMDPKSMSKHQWLEIVELASKTAYLNPENHPDTLHWSAITILAYEKLLNDFEVTAAEQPLALMRLKGAKAGAFKDYPEYFSLKKVLNWILSAIKMSPKELHYKAHTWTETSIPEDLIALRKIKNRLEILEHLREKFPDDVPLPEKEYKFLMALYPLLP